MTKKSFKLFRVLTTLVSALLVVLFCAPIFYLLSKYSMDEAFNIIFKYYGIGVVVIVVLIVIGGAFINKNYKNSIKKKYQERKFKYLDTFFYGKYETRTEHTVYHFYHLIQDVETNKKYIISKEATNSQVEINLSGNSIVFRGEGFRNKWQKVSFEDEGSFWIKKEIPEFFEASEDKRIIAFTDNVVYFKSQDAYEKTSKVFGKKTYPLFNINPDYSIKDLDEATYITGLAEFYMK